MSSVPPSLCDGEKENLKLDLVVRVSAETFGRSVECEENTMFLITELNKSKLSK